VSREGSEPEFGLDGGALCLDFVNTLGDRPRCQQEKLRSYDDLLAFAVEAGILNRAELPSRRRRAARQAAAARAAFGRAVKLREGLYRAFAARAGGKAPASSDLDAVNDALRRALPHQRLVAAGDGLAWRWEQRDDLEYPLWPIARSAADLLLSPECVRVHECASDVCSWLFIDRSPAARRRWCDMKVCGNRAKARRHYERRMRGVATARRRRA
jgi:predicted RNA-binding Zn ribbon-like protein